MILGLALIPSKSFQDEVNAYRKRYDKEYVRIQPHITIKSRFEVNDAEVDNVKAEIEKRVQGAQPAEVHATKASNFAPTTNVIYFKVEKTDALDDLFARFNGKDFYGEAEHPFIPHFTIAQGLTSQEFEDIYGQVRLAGVDHKETISQLSLLQFDEAADKWQVLENYPLG